MPFGEGFIRVVDMLWAGLEAGRTGAMLISESGDAYDTMMSGRSVSVLACSISKSNGTSGDA